MKRILFFLFILVDIAVIWFLYTEIFTAEAQKRTEVYFSVEKGESVQVLAGRLEEEHIIRQGWLFKLYVQIKGMDKTIQAGEYKVTKPITLARVVEAMQAPSIKEREITIIPGWNLRDIAKYFEKENISTQEEFFAALGEPAYAYGIRLEKAPELDMDANILKSKPSIVSAEGYLAPDTYRIYLEDPLKEVLVRLVAERDKQFDEELRGEIEKQKRTVHEVLTLASIVEREVQTKEDKAMVADIFWRRYDANWALQADSTVHYALGKEGNVFTTKEDRNSTSPWNTYAYPGLPPGPISNPSLETIQATVYPKKNSYWYFLTNQEGEVKYAETLEGHNENVQKYLR